MVVGLVVLQWGLVGSQELGEQKYRLVRVGGAGTAQPQSWDKWLGFPNHRVLPGMHADMQEIKLTFS